MAVCIPVDSCILSVASFLDMIFLMNLSTPSQFSCLESIRLIMLCWFVELLRVCSSASHSSLQDVHANNVCTGLTPRHNRMHAKRRWLFAYLAEVFTEAYITREGLGQVLLNFSKWLIAPAD